MPNWTNEQKLAIDLDNRNILVSAGAGSGKTAVLTERVINKIRKGVKINQLLILTFTNAAASEMKERIRKALTKEGYTNELMLLDSSYITTFDSFALSIVKRYHYLLKISKEVEITPECIIDVQKRRIIDDLFSEFYENNDRLVLDVIKNFCFKSDDDIKNVLFVISNKLDNLVDKDKYLNDYFKEYDQRIEKQINVFEEVIKSKVQDIIILLHELENTCSEKIKVTIYNIINDLENKRPIYELKDALKFKLPNKTKECTEEYPKIKEEVNKQVNKTCELLIYNSKDDFINEINKTRELQKLIIDLSIEIEKRIKEFKENYSLYTFSDIQKKAIDVVSNNNSVREELVNEFKEIMIDEYQDTSDIQEMFISLISNNNVYMVGDMKQSIYRFRNANPELFKEKYATFKDPNLNEKSAKIDLIDNFRSRVEVVNTINTIFSGLMDNSHGGVDYIKSHIMKQGNRSYDIMPEHFDGNIYQTEVLDYGSCDVVASNHEKEAFIIAEDIINKINNKYLVFDKDLLEEGVSPYRLAKYSDFAILIDRSTNFDIYKKIFEYYNIPLQVFKDDKLFEGNNINIICNLVKFIYLIYMKNYETDFRYLYVSIARSFLFSEYDDVILNNVTNKFIFNTEIYQKGLKVAKQVGSSTFKNIILMIIDEFNFYDRINLVGDIDKCLIEVEYLLTLAESINRCNNSFEYFVNFIEDLTKYKIDLKYQSNQGGQESVKIMSVHKSKGLEFPVVYCAGLHSPFNENEIKTNYMFDKDIGIICPYYYYGIRNTFLKNNYIYKYKSEELSERIRLFYVMLTRAKEKIIFITKSIENNDLDLPDELRKRKINSFHGMLCWLFENGSYNHKCINLDNIYTDQYNVNKTLDLSSLSTENVIKCDNNNFDNTEKIINQRLSKRSFNIDDDKTKAKKLIGTKVHHIFECIDFEKALTDLNYLTELNVDYKEYLFNFFNLEIFKGKKVLRVFKEYEFSYYNSDKLINGIIDLMIEFDDCVMIIDYKLKNINDDNYLKQLQGYYDFIIGHYDKNVFCYLYSILDNNLKKVI